MNLATIPPGADFLPTLATLWRDRMAGGRLHDGLILLPTRRAARALAAAFLHGAGDTAILLPRIVALGGLEEAPLALAGALDLPPAIGQAHRRAQLSRLILAMPDAAGGPRRADTAWTLAGDLATLMDEAERAEIDLADGLRRAADGAHAQHWDQTLTFLSIVTEHWPAYLAEQGLANPAARQVKLLDAQADAWRAAPPNQPVLVVGDAGDIPAIGRLLRVVATLPTGLVVLPGLDTALDEDVFAALDEAHPQFGLRTLLSQIGARRDDAAIHGHPARPERAALLSHALLPASALGAWQTGFTPALPGITRLAPSDAQEEAVGIALILRDTLEQPGARAALVTPDRALAHRVAAELGRWGVIADDSAGEPLAETPPAVFLRLIVACVSERLAPVPLLALLKHPLTGAGLPTTETRRRARHLELACLRGPAPHPGLPGLRRALDTARPPRHAAPSDDPLADPSDDPLADPSDDPLADPLHDLLARLEACLAPLLRRTAAAVAAPADLLAALITAAEALAATDDRPGPARLWALEEGEALAQLLAETQEALPALPHGAPACLPGLLDAVLAGTSVRSRRAQRAAAGTASDTEDATHPRIFIWGLLEARLQSAETIVLGGLTEGVWPAASDPGPWMSRPMRARAGLPSPELRIGQSAHDFCMAACAAPRLVLSVPRRRDSAPCVPSRWIVRLDALLRRAGGIPPDDALDWARRLDLPSGGAQPVRAPSPAPPVRLRPRRLNVTEIATLLADPYAIHARRILRLERLEPLEQSADFRDYGNVVHGGLHAFMSAIGLAWPDDAAPALAARLAAALRAAGVRAALIAWWTPRLDRIAAWVDGEERRRRTGPALVASATERKAEWVIDRPGGPFKLVGRADRLDALADGTSVVFDYKTGTLPSPADVTLGRAPQLLLEAAMAELGAFGPEFALPTGQAIYWRLSGAHESGSRLVLFGGDADRLASEVAEAWLRLFALIDRFDDPATAYPAQRLPAARARGQAGRASDYAQLARAAEWGSAEEDSEPDPDSES